MTVRRALLLVCITWAPLSCAPTSSQTDSLAASAARIASVLEDGDYVAAEDRSRVHAEAVRRANGERSLEMAAARDLLVRALVANGKGSSDEARSLTSLALEAKESRLGPDHPALVSSLENLARVLGDARQDEEAVGAAKRALTIQEHASASPESLSRTLDHLGRALARAGHHDDAVKALERSLRLDGRARDDRNLARSLEALASALQDKGDYKAADEPLSRALELRRRDAAHPEYIETLSLLSYQEWSRGRFGAARDAASSASALAERALRPDHPARARAVRLLGDSKLDLWELEAARDLMQQALQIAERGLGPAHPDIAGYLNNLASAALLMGDYQTARTLYDRSLGIREAQFGKLHEAVATAVFNLALLDTKLGDNERARAEYRRAMEIWERVYSPDHAFVAHAAVELADVTAKLGRPAEALPLLERALLIRERSHGHQHRLVAVTLKALAETYRLLGRPADARRETERALRIWVEMGSPDDQQHAAVLALSAELSAERGDVRGARRGFEQALGIDERVFGKAHPDVAQVRMGLARTLARGGDASSALTGAQDAEAIGREHLRLMLRSLPEREALNYATVRPRGADLMLSIVGVVPEATIAGLDAVIRSRAVVLDEVASRRRAAAADPSSGNAALAKELAVAQQRLANLAVRGLGSMTAARYGELLDAARRDSELAERRLVEASASFRLERTRAQVGLDAVSAALPPRSSLVSFVRYQQLRRGSPRVASTGGDIDTGRAAETPAYLAFVVSAGRSPIAVKLGDAGELESLVTRWRSDVGADVLAPPSGRGSVPLSRISGQALRKIVWDPLSAHVADATTVFVVADGALGLVPFAALPVGENGYLLEQVPPIHYLTAERDLVMAHPNAAEHGRGLLALGGATFERTLLPGSGPTGHLVPAGEGSAATDLRAASLSCGGLQNHRFGPLAGTLDEVQDLSRIWSAAPAGSPARVLTGSAATERAVKDEARNHLVLHLATHGFFLDETCSSSAPAVAGSRGVGGLSSVAPVQNPLRLSGLALAGANGRAEARPDQEDGILTAEEVASLDLQGVEWAVLSACDTGVGEIKAGEGVFGLRRAFQVAGARTVIMSLWSVDDQATRAWMRALYEGRFQRQLSTADAVHQASLTVLRDRRARGQSTHPFFWAAFVAAGDWR